MGLLNAITCRPRTDPIQEENIRQACNELADDLKPAIDVVNEWQSQTDTYDRRKQGGFDYGHGCSKALSTCGRVNHGEHNAALKYIANEQVAAARMNSAQSAMSLRTLAQALEPLPTDFRKLGGLDKEKQDTAALERIAERLDEGIENVRDNGQALESFPNDPGNRLDALRLLNRDPLNRRQATALVFELARVANEAHKVAETKKGCDISGVLSSAENLAAHLNARSVPLIV